MFLMEIVSNKSYMFFTINHRIVTGTTKKLGTNRAKFPVFVFKILLGTVTLCNSFASHRKWLLKYFQIDLGHFTNRPDADIILSGVPDLQCAVFLLFVCAMNTLLKNLLGLKETRRERLKSALYLRLKKRKTFFFGKKLEIFDFFSKNVA